MMLPEFEGIGVSWSMPYKCMVNWMVFQCSKRKTAVIRAIPPLILHVPLPQLLTDNCTPIGAQCSLTNDQVNKILCLAKQGRLNVILPSISIFHSHDKKCFQQFFILLSEQNLLSTFYGAQLYARYQGEFIINIKHASYQWKLYDFFVEPGYHIWEALYMLVWNDSNRYRQIGHSILGKSIVGLVTRRNFT